MLSNGYEKWGLIILTILLFALGATISLIFILNQKKFHFNKKLLQVETEFQKTMLLTQLEIQEQTFSQISREIHDHIGQRLTLARLYINGLTDIISKQQIEILMESSTLIEEAISDLKHLSKSLTANLIRDEGLIYALKLEINRISKITSIKINLNYRDDFPFMSVENELIIFRIIQEAMQNVIKHAGATRVDIDFDYSNETLSLKIIDNGKGFNLQTIYLNEKGSKSGLENLRKRAALLQGSFDISSREGEGTSLNFIFPAQPKLMKYATI